ncbi:hypothetical protein TNCV_3850901 [Trichonephila clavipes]|nr:hypothetical protein TNCV_3850901 [Trichonephila clavipes]
MGQKDCNKEEPCPKVVDVHNDVKGGVDRFDQRKERYQISRSLKWWKEPTVSLQAKKCVVPDDVCLSSVGNLMPNMVSNYRRFIKCRRKGQENKNRYMRAEWDVPFGIAMCFSSFCGE